MALPLRQVTRLTGGLKPEESGRWIVAIHGLGDTPENFQNLSQGANFKARWFFPAAPHARDWYGGARGGDGEKLERNLELAAAIVAQYLEHLSADPKNEGLPIVTGFSQGGMLSYALVALYPERVSAALPIAGMLPPSLWQKIGAAGRPAPPISAFHGRSDQVIPFAATETELLRLQAAGYPAQLTALDNVAHRIPEPLHRAWQAALALQLARH
jgi:phospholipase/carboxylesterase